MAEETSMQNLRIEQYKAYMEDLAHIGSRHETARAFYLSVLSALLAFVALGGKDGPLKGIGTHLFELISVGAIAICVLWLANTLSFAALYRAKLIQLTRMEEKLPYQNFAAEFEELKADWRYFRITTVEGIVAFVFITLFLVALILNTCAGY